jgi:NAD(P)-dependent dehydrogenase (short-subunit alcohol dehydrogenase family)
VLLGTTVLASAVLAPGLRVAAPLLCMVLGRHFHALKGVSWLEPEVIANAALFLNSHLAETITGAALPVDAGHLLLTGFNHALTL